jgi:Flp pilus assembly protein TadD
VALAIAGIVAISVPLAGTSAVRESQELARQGDLAGALAEARTAVNVQPYSATAHMQEALILENVGSLAPAEAAATRAIDAEPTNWRTWLLRSRLRAKRGEARAAVADFRRARSLNPRSPLFAR